MSSETILTAAIIGYLALIVANWFSEMAIGCAWIGDDDENREQWR